MEILQVKLRPDGAQAARIEKTFCCCLELWNRMLEDEKKLQRELGRHFIPTPARYKREMPALKEADSLALTAIHTALENAFQGYAYNPHDHKAPEPMTHCSAYLTFCQQRDAGPSIRFTGGGLKLPKLGVVPVESHQELPGGAVIHSAEICREEAGYFCRLAYQAAGAENAPAQVRFHPVRGRLKYSKPAPDTPRALGQRNGGAHKPQSPGEERR